MGKIQEAIDRARNSGRVPAVRAPAMSDAIISDRSVTKLTNTVAESRWPARTVEVVQSSLQEERVIAGMEFDDRAGPYRQLRAQVLKLMKENNWKSLAITSAHESAGKTLTAVNLAISISRDVNHSVLLVDLDLRTPSVCEKFSIEVDHGLLDYLSRQVELHDILINPGYERLVILPGQSTGRFASEILVSPEMKQLLRDISEDSDVSRIVVFDLPPLLRNDDALVITPLADATLLIVEDGVTTEEQLRRALQMLKGANLIGTVLNKVRS